MRSRHHLVFVVGLVLAGLLVASCGSSGGDASKGTTTTAAKGTGTTKPGSKATQRACASLRQLVLAGFGVDAPKATAAVKKQSVDKVLAQLKAMGPTAPKSVQGALLTTAAYFTAVKKATASATTGADFDAKKKAVDAKAFTTGSAAVSRYLAKNC